MNKFLKLAIVIFILIFISVVISYIVGSYLISPTYRNIPKANSSIVFEDIAFTSESGSLIKGWFVKGDYDSIGIILMHGNGGNRLSMVNRAEFLNHIGYSVLLFDFQAHGESIGTYKTFGYLESFDAKAAFQFIKDEKGCERIGIIGFSLGGAATILGDEPVPADAYIFESVYPKIEKAISNRLKIKLGELGQMFTPFLTIQLKLILGISIENLSPVEKIKNLNSPVLLISGKLDQRTTLEDSMELFDAIEVEKSIWVIEGAYHEDYFQFAEDEYKLRISNFLSKHLLNSK